MNTACPDREADQGFRPSVTNWKLSTRILEPMGKLASFVKGYTLGTVFVLVHVVTHELRTQQLRPRNLSR